VDGLKILLLPGLDGGGFYCATLLEALSRDHDCELMAYPRHLFSYEDLCEWVCDRLDTSSDYVIITESFGGPLGILVAEVLETQAKGLVLCATFCEPPVPGFLISLAAMLYPRIVRFRWMAHAIDFFICNGRSPAIASQLHRVLKENSDSAVARRIRILRDLDMRPISSTLTLPCLVIKAARDRLVWFNSFSHLSNAVELTIDGPHGLMGMRPKAVTEAISGFIKAKI
jgi:pimeloyl-ACP methyl ester carboxylesterase